MKSLKKYLVEEDNQQSLLDLRIDEGILKSIGKLLSKTGEKVQQAGEKTDEIRKKFSDAAKAAWDSLKKSNPEIEQDQNQEQIMTQTLSAIDNDIVNNKEEVQQFANKNGIKADELELTITNILAVAMTNQKTNFVQEIIAQNDANKMSGLRAMIMGLLAAKKNGIDANQMGALMGVINKSSK